MGQHIRTWTLLTRRIIFTCAHDCAAYVGSARALCALRWPAKKLHLRTWRYLHGNSHQASGIEIYAVKTRIYREENALLENIITFCTRSDISRGTRLTARATPMTVPIPVRFLSAASRTSAVTPSGDNPTPNAQRQNLSIILTPARNSKTSIVPTDASYPDPFSAAFPPKPKGR